MRLLDCDRLGKSRMLRELRIPLPMLPVISAEADGLMSGVSAGGG